MKEPVSFHKFFELLLFSWPEEDSMLLKVHIEHELLLRSLLLCDPDFINTSMWDISCSAMERKSEEKVL